MKDQEAGSGLAENLSVTAKRFIFFGLVTIAISIVIASVQNNRPLTARASNFGPPAVAANVQPGFQDEVQIKLTGSGFVPAQVEHAAGTFALAVENETLATEYRLQLKAEDGTVLREIVVQKGSSAWSVTLQSGQYTLVEAQNPQWICRINVQ